MAGVLGLFQAMTIAGMELPFMSSDFFYLSVTAHGVLMALVFTTFFIMGLGYLVTKEQLGFLVGEKVGWFAFWLALVGTVGAAVTILGGKATVLYTFYPPLEAHPVFYIGLLLCLLLLLLSPLFLLRFLLLASFLLLLRLLPLSLLLLFVFVLLSLSSSVFLVLVLFLSFFPYNRFHQFCIAIGLIGFSYLIVRICVEFFVFCASFTYGHAFPPPPPIPFN